MSAGEPVIMENFLTLEDIITQINNLDPSSPDYQVELFKWLAFRTSLLDSIKKHSEEMLFRELAADYKISLTSPSQIMRILCNIGSNPAKFSDCVASEENKKRRQSTIVNYFGDCGNV